VIVTGKIAKELETPALLREETTAKQSGERQGAWQKKVK